MKLITPIALLAATIGLFFIFISPRYESVSSLRAEVREYDLAIDRAKEVVTKRNQLLTKKNSFSKVDLERLNKLLPDKVDNIRLIIDVNDIANRYNSNINTIKIAQEKPTTQASATQSTKPYTSIELSFQTKMTYENIQKFLIDIEDSLKLLDVGTLSIVIAEDPVNYDYNVMLKAYYLKP
jgi:hypothetical protein